MHYFLIILLNFTIICVLEVVYIEYIWMVEIPRPGALHTVMRLVVSHQFCHDGCVYRIETGKQCKPQLDLLLC